MSAESPKISRRTLTKGAAWATPVVALGATLPIASASPASCPTVNCWKITGAQMTYTTALSGSPLNPDGSSPDSVVTLNMGWWELNGAACTLPDAAYYRVNITGVVGYDTLGGAHNASNLAGEFLQYGDTAGGQWGPSMDFKGFASYPGATQWTPLHRLTTFVISYQYTLLDLNFDPITAVNQPCTITLTANCENGVNCGDGTLLHVA